MTPSIKRQLRRGSAVELVIGRLKSDHRMGRNYLWHPQGDAINAVLAAAGYNFRPLIRWLRLLLSLILAPPIARPQLIPRCNPYSSRWTSPQGLNQQAVAADEPPSVTPSA